MIRLAVRAVLVIAAALWLAVGVVVVRDFALTEADESTLILPEPPCDPRPLPTRSYQPFEPARHLQMIGGVELGLPEHRAIALTPDSIALFVSGVEVARFDRQFGPHTITEIARVIDDPDWLDEVEPGVFEVQAAIMQEPRSELEIRGPEVSELRLVNRPGVMLFGDNSRAVIDGVLLTSWDPELGSFDRESLDGRPFLLYQNGADVLLENSSFVGLGSDRNLSYGVTFRDYDTRAVLRNSTISWSYFGVYTWETEGTIVEDNLFELNDVYGIDPHDRSRELIIRNNVSRCNGRHGIIISEEVTDSLIEGNLSYANRLNGVMVDKKSHRAVVVDNVAWGNLGDGIVVAASGDVMIKNNESLGNRVGVRLTQEGTDGTILEQNDVRGNLVGFEALEAVGSVDLRSNQWVENQDIGLMLSSLEATATDETITGSTVGVDVRSPTELTGVAVSDATTGVVIRAGEVSLTDSEIRASKVGVRNDQAAPAVVEDSSVRSRRAIVGPAEIGRDSFTSDQFRLEDVIRLALVIGTGLAVMVALASVHRRLSANS